MLLLVLSALDFPLIDVDLSRFIAVVIDGSAEANRFSSACAADAALSEVGLPTRLSCLEVLS
jgi:hypothetical protein